MFKSEAEMREAAIPRMESANALREFIDSLVSMKHDYGTCAYAMSMAAVAAYEYVAGQLGVTGFQASFADLDIIRRTRRLDGPFMLVTLDKSLYPQYDLLQEVQKFINKNAKWRKEKAKEFLQEKNALVHPNVLAHWETLATLETGNE